MAIIKRFDDEDQNQETQQIQQTSAPQQQMTQGPIASGVQGTSPRFQNLSKFMTANKDVNYNQQILGRLNKQAQNIGNLAIEAKKQTAPELERLQAGSGVIQKAGENLIGLEQPDVEQFQKLRRGEFRKEFDIQQKPEIQRNVQNIEQLGQGIKSEAGRFKILQQAYRGNPTYNRGFAAMDQLLLQRDPEKLAQLRTGLQETGQIARSGLTDIEGAEKMVREQIKGLGEQRQNEALDFLKTQREGLFNPLEQRAKTLKEELQAGQYNLRRKLMKGDDLSEQDYNLLGIDTPEKLKAFNSEYNLARQNVLFKRAEEAAKKGIGDLKQFQSDKFDAGDIEVDVTPFLNLNNLAELTPESLATAEEVAKSQALANLAEDTSRLTKVGRGALGLKDVVGFDPNQAIQKIRSHYAQKYLKDNAGGKADISTPEKKAQAQRLLFRYLANPMGFNVDQTMNTSLAGPMSSLVPGTDVTMGDAFSAVGITPEQVQEYTKYLSPTGGLISDVQMEEAYNKVISKMPGGKLADSAVGLSGLGSGMELSNDAMERALSTIGALQKLDIERAAASADPGELITRQAVRMGLSQDQADKLAMIINPAGAAAKRVQAAAAAAAAAAASRASSAARSVGNAVKKIFCFTGNQDVIMSDASKKKVKDLKPGDVVAAGGSIKKIEKHKSNDIYNYRGVEVTGEHAVFKDGKWIRIKEIPEAKKLGKEADVYAITNEKHMLLLKDCIFADFEEINGSGNTDKDNKENIKKMNKGEIEKISKLEKLDNLLKND